MIRPEDIRLGVIAQIAVSVKDVARATEFYRDRLGIPFLFDAPGLAFFQCGGIMLMLSKPETPEFDHPSAVLYFQVEEINAAHRALVERGVEFIDTPHVVHRDARMELWMAFFRDPDGNVLAIRMEKSDRVRQGEAG
jgi:catechol 2,3-dioxygenase-like lactoylglutathione lyase family enzyme